MLPSDNALPVTPSPKYISNLLSILSCKKYTLDVEDVCVLSVARVNVVQEVEVELSNTSTSKVVVSPFSS